MLMKHFLDDSFKREYLEIPANIKSDEYYIKMVVSCFLQPLYQSFKKGLKI